MPRPWSTSYSSQAARGAAACLALVVGCAPATRPAAPRAADPVLVSPEVPGAVASPPPSTQPAVVRTTSPATAPALAAAPATVPATTRAARIAFTPFEPAPPTTNPAAALPPAAEGTYVGRDSTMPGGRDRWGQTFTATADGVLREVELGLARVAVAGGGPMDLAIVGVAAASGGDRPGDGPVLARVPFHADDLVVAAGTTPDQVPLVRFDVSPARVPVRRGQRMAIIVGPSDDRRDDAAYRYRVVTGDVYLRGSLQRFDVLTERWQGGLDSDLYFRVRADPVDRAATTATTAPAATPADGKLLAESAPRLGVVLAAAVPREPPATAPIARGRLQVAAQPLQAPDGRWLIELRAFNGTDRPLPATAVPLTITVTRDGDAEGTIVFPPSGRAPSTRPVRGPRYGPLPGGPGMPMPPPPPPPPGMPPRAYYPPAYMNEAASPPPGAGYIRHLSLWPRPEPLSPGRYRVSVAFQPALNVEPVEAEFEVGAGQ